MMVLGAVGIGTVAIIGSILAALGIGKGFWGQAQAGSAQRAMQELETKKLTIGQDASRRAMASKQRAIDENWERLERAKREEREEGIQRDYMQSTENAKQRQLQMAMMVLQSITQNQRPQFGQGTMPSIPQILRGA